MRAKLIAQQEFTSGGVTYAPGDTIPSAALSRWPEGALANRVRNGFVEWDGQPDAEESADDGTGEDADPRAARVRELAALKADEVKEIASGYELEYVNKGAAIEAIVEHEFTAADDGTGEDA